MLLIPKMVYRPTTFENDGLSYIFASLVPVNSDQHHIHFVFQCEKVILKTSSSLQKRLIEKEKWWALSCTNIGFPFFSCSKTFNIRLRKYQKSAGVFFWNNQSSRVLTILQKPYRTILSKLYVSHCQMPSDVFLTLQNPTLNDLLLSAHKACLPRGLDIYHSRNVPLFMYFCTFIHSVGLNNQDL